MGERRLARSRAGFRRSRRLRRDRRGVVAVVGTLLALLVFFALFGVFLTQYVPLWMEQNESQLSNSLVASLSTLKSGVDDQYLFGGIPSYSVPFTVSSQAVPLFAQPTVATLAYLVGCPGGFGAGGVPTKIAACAFESLSYSTAGAGGGNHPFGQTASTNYLSVSVPNRYYPPVTYILSADGVVGEQSTYRQWMVVPPPINITKTTGNLSFQSSQLFLVGNASSFTSPGSKDVTSHLLSRTTASSQGRFLTKTGTARSFNVTLTLGVFGVCGWYNYLYNSTLAALGPSGSGWSLTVTGASGVMTPPFSLSTCLAAAATTTDVTLTIKSVNYASAFVAEAALTFNAGGL